ncbi:site-2 protease family protein [Candidatus Dojkabacteria bacterium]|uniref:Site-2 protease family protein n=1 Tax=Candidatus Dojkabacteria bacterium TaxID=2099670 RepID=A0A955HYY8_9BACT|nr:site-2 protease family protein [Candidatus Dojkabacteria bacterium]
MLVFIINILLILGVLGLLILVHEFGHFAAAKLSGVRVDEFAIGMGPKVWSKKHGETVYMLNLLPIGGYVKILGEGDDLKDFKGKLKEDPRNMLNKPLYIKVFIMLAGVLMNLLTAVVIFYIFLFVSNFKFVAPDEVAGYTPLFGQDKYEVLEQLKYTELTDDGNAIKNGWPDSGYILSINNEKITRSDEFGAIVKANKGKQLDVEICLELQNDNSCKIYKTDISKDGFVGILLTRNYIHYIEYAQPAEKIFGGFAHSLNMVQLGATHIKNIFSDASKTGNYEDAVNTVSSPVGLYFIVDYLRQVGVWGILDLVANLSLTLFVMNILPIPALDGGRVLLVILEKAFGRFWSKNVEAWLIKLSFIFVIVFLLATVVKDFIYLDYLRNLFH